MSFYSYFFNNTKFFNNKLNLYNIYQLWAFDFISFVIFISNLENLLDDFLWQAYFILRLFTGKLPCLTISTFKFDYFTSYYKVEFFVFVKRKKFFVFALYIFRKLLNRFLQNQLSIRFFNNYLFIILLNLKHLEYLDLKKEFYKWTNVLFITLSFLNLLICLAKKIFFLSSLYSFHAVYQL